MTDELPPDLTAFAQLLDAQPDPACPGADRPRDPGRLPLLPGADDGRGRESDADRDPARRGGVELGVEGVRGILDEEIYLRREG